MRFHRIAVLSLLVTTGLVQAPSGAVAAELGLEAFGTLGGPVAPDFFAAGWGYGLGIGGGLLADLGAVEIVLQGEFAQFTFDGYEGLGTLGGERRFSCLWASVRLRAWESDGPRQERFSVAAGAGFGHQAIAGTFGEGGGGVEEAALLGDGTEDGLMVTGSAEFSRSLYRTTRWFAGVRYTHFNFENESPAHVTLALGLRMPLAGSRPQ